MYGALASAMLYCLHTAGPAGIYACGGGFGPRHDGVRRARTGNRSLSQSSAQESPGFSGGEWSRLFFAVLVVLGILAPAAIGQRIAAPRTFAPRGAIIGTVSTGTSLANAWATGSGIARLDIGGGAGPGVQAPGSAGLPVKTTKS